MGKFDAIEEKFEKVVSKASLKSKKSRDLKNIMVYNVPKEWSEILKNSGISFSTYAKMAIQEKLKRDGLI